MSMFLARIGALVHENPKFTQIIESMVCASFAAKYTKQKTMNNTLQHSSLNLETELVESQGVVSALLEQGPQPLGEMAGLLKHKAMDILEPPLFCQGFVWLDSDNRHSSPSALYTETVPLLLTPPQHVKVKPPLNLVDDRRGRRRSSSQGQTSVLC